MSIPGFRIIRDFQDSGPAKIYGAESLADKLPVLIKVQSCYDESQHKIDALNNDHMVSVDLSLYSDHALRPIDFRRSKELTYIVYA
ncbi:MAG: hypothetical protein OEY43_09975, partial [Gammaproteobacteria bacterium]|nr:hypothetical protein [Gammaproteobacteria bacterium]